jgi:hypothetical protein
MTPVRRSQFAVSAVVASVTLCVLFASRTCTRSPNASRPYNPYIAAPYVAMRDLRAIGAAEQAYKAANGGWYDKPECLVRPQDCIPGYKGPSFLDRDFLLAESEYYRREFHPGPVTAAAVIAASHASPSSLETFAVVAMPIDIPVDLRRKYFGICIDGLGYVCVTLHGGRPRVVRGACVVTPGDASILERALPMRWHIGDEPCYRPQPAWR